MSDGRFDPYNERLWDPSQPSTLADRINDKPGGPDALAAALVRRNKAAELYRQRPRLAPFIARVRGRR